MKSCSAGMRYLPRKTQRLRTRAMRTYGAIRCGRLSHLLRNIHVSKGQRHRYHCTNWIAATHCNTQQHTATHCNTLHKGITARPGSFVMYMYICTMQHYEHTLQYTAQHTATHCITLQHTLQHTAHRCHCTHWIVLSCTCTCAQCNTLDIHYNTLHNTLHNTPQHTAHRYHCTNWIIL